ncbi:MAG: class I SAM-dependent methyltransferase [Croceibacterium sp.]
MTTRDKTGIRSVGEDHLVRPLGERLFTVAWGAIQWPWLARSLWGGPLSAKHALLDRLGLPYNALPHLGSWKADTYFLTRIVDAIERLRPRNVVEIGCGATSLVIARALQHHGGGRLTSYDQHGEFVDKTAEWLAENGLASRIIRAPLVLAPNEWSSSWYQLRDVPESIDLLVIDGPHWALHPFGRGRAEVLFDRIPRGGMILLDDAARPGERVVARRWRKRWPRFDFRLLGGPAGTLVGERTG